jgi:hypothetical protein
MNPATLRKLSDSAVALHYTLRLLGGKPTVHDLAFARGKSVAAIYRACAELYDAGLPPVLSSKPAKRVQRIYCQRAKSQEGGI